MIKRQFTAACFMAAGLMIAGTANAQKSAPQFSLTNKSVKVFVTEKGTDNRITPTETLHFEAKQQPGETEVAVFVDRSRSFQTMLGIGDALKDSSAQDFYKLPKVKQRYF